MHITGWVHYQHLAESMRPPTDHPWAELFNAPRKVVFSRTLKTADWANTTIASGDLAEEVDKLRRGGDGYILVSGGISFWRSLARLDLIDEYRVTLVPYLAAPRAPDCSTTQASPVSSTSCPAPPPITA